MLLTCLNHSVPSVQKLLKRGASKTAGKNHTGRTTVFHMGGGHKRKKRFVDKNLGNAPVAGLIVSTNYTPYQSNTLSLIRVPLKEDPTTSLYFYSPSTHSIKDNSFLSFGGNAKSVGGNRTVLQNIPTGTLIHNVELYPAKGSCVARSAGTSCQVIRNDGSDKTLVKLPSGKTILLNSKCLATIGICSNVSYKNQFLKKAGSARWLGVRPTVRGIAMNPVDHPHGGRTGGGRHPRTPWGKLTRGVKTRSR
uniref:ribosomal protein L2 n=1 Tax=Ancyromonas sigmoides TaxID=85707 RepID=UPI0028CFDDC3|nr:ribosomal protein L2 [Ancyromonas sigmoides]WMQ52551.1 ribosomal protein L2 [Ancyromonas sigmoides]